MNDESNALLNEIITLIAQMTRTPPTMLQLTLRPHQQGGWMAVIGRAGLDMQFAVGANPDAAIMRLFETVLRDVRAHKIAIDTLLKKYDRPEIRHYTAEPIDENQE